MNELNIMQVKETSGGIVDGGCVIGPKVPIISKVFKQERYMKTLNIVQLEVVSGGVSTVYHEGAWLQAIKDLMNQLK